MKTLTLLLVGACVALLGVGGAHAQGMPNVTGIWTGACTAVASGDGYMASFTARFRILNQQGPLFRGYIVFSVPGSSTNWFSGNLLPSKPATSGFDVSMAITSDQGDSFVGSALLATNSLPWTMARLQMVGFNGDVGIHGNLFIRGSLTKK